MRILVTGANGFIGRQLVARLLAAPPPDLADFRELVLLDLHFAGRAPDLRLRYAEGSIADPTLLESVFRYPVDLIFHLACIAGGAAEERFDLGRQVNLDSTMRLLELARRQAAPPRIVFSSSIGVYGELPPLVTDDTPARPTWSYGTHKLIGELLMADYTRKGFVDARTLRFPGVVARPADPSGALSAFLSDLIREVAQGWRFELPVSPGAVSWWMSVGCCIDNVLHAATMPAPGPGAGRVWALPPLRASIEEVVDGLARVYGVPARELVSYAPLPAIEERFGRLPEARFERSEAMGFHNDGSVDAMVRRALAQGVEENKMEISS
jgi:nucleoside-diphosphate-sugar epimerase